MTATTLLSRRQLLMLLAMVIAFAGLGKRYTIPQNLAPGDTIALLSPSSCVDAAKVERGIKVLNDWGYNVKIFPHALTSCGSYPADARDLADDLNKAFADKNIKAVMATRGGFGSPHLFKYLDAAVMRANPKWLIGFSDISALHAYMLANGMISLHAMMAAQLGDASPEQERASLLKGILKGDFPESYTIASHPLNKPGKASGILKGGNMIVLNNLIATPYDIFSIGKRENVVLFLEEVGEKIYAVDRMLTHLHQAGVLRKVKGLIFGQFTDYVPDEDFSSMEEMIHARLTEWGYYDIPGYAIVFGFPTGHNDSNWPMPQGMKVSLEAGDAATVLRFVR